MLLLRNFYRKNVQLTTYKYFSEERSSKEKPETTILTFEKIQTSELTQKTPKKIFVSNRNFLRLRAPFSEVSLTPWTSWINIAACVSSGLVLFHMQYFFLSAVVIWPATGSILKCI